MEVGMEGIVLLTLVAKMVAEGRTRSTRTPTND